MKKFLIIIGTIPGFLMILLSISANKIIDDSNMESIKRLFKLTADFNDINNTSSLLTTVVKINEYSHWIITLGVIWLVIFGFLWELNKGDKNGKNNKQ